MRKSILMIITHFTFSGYTVTPY